MCNQCVSKKQKRAKTKNKTCANTTGLFQTTSIRKTIYTIIKVIKVSKVSKVSKKQRYSAREKTISFQYSVLEFGLKAVIMVTTGYVGYHGYTISHAFGVTYFGRFGKKKLLLTVSPSAS